MSRKFIPNGDLDFVTMAESFARVIAREPVRFAISQEDSDELTALVKCFREALQACLHGERTKSNTRAKEDARDAATDIIRRLANQVRANRRIDSASKVLLGIWLRDKTPRALVCPQEQPRLKFLRALHEGASAVPRHELKFYAAQFGKAKPAGAVRLELFVDLVPPEEPIPEHPGANLHSRPWYLRSYTRSPIVITPPMTRVPMRVVYWGRWADSTGNVGPFSATAEAWIEGGAMYRPQIEQGSFAGCPKPPRLLEDVNAAETTSAPGQRDAIYRVLMLEAQVQSFQPQQVPALPERAEPKQLEAPRESEAA